MLTRWRVIVALLLVVAFVLSRTLFLTRLPIFTDEAIYIRWGQIALGDPVHRFISLQDGKQPLFIWLMLPLLKAIDDPLLAGRLVSVGSGLMTLLGIIVLGWVLFVESVGWMSGVFYLVIPFFVLYDRLALYDSLTTATMVWSLVFLWYVTKRLHLDAALLAGMTIGAGLLTKSSVQFALFLIPTLLLEFDWKQKEWRKRLFNWVVLVSVAASLALGFQLLLKLAPLSHMIRLKNLEFIVSSGEFFRDPASRLVGNLRGLSEWLGIYLTFPVVGLLLYGIVSGLKDRWKTTLLLLFWFGVPFFALAAFAKILYPRFLLFMAAPLLPIMAYGFLSLKRRLRHSPRLFFSVCFLLFFYPVYASTVVVADPLKMPIPQVDRFQLLDDWPSGYGIPEVVDFLKEEGAKEHIFVGTEGTFGLTPSALEIYLKDQKNIRIKGYWPISSGMPELAEIARSGLVTYVLFKDTQVPDPSWKLVPVAKYRKGLGDVYMSLYRVLPTDS